jgi:hypothetical protein
MNLTLLIKMNQHQLIRNDDDYDDWEYGTEPLPNEPWLKEDATFVRFIKHSCKDTTNSPT